MNRDLIVVGLANEKDIWKAIEKNQKKIKSLRGKVFVLAIGCVIMAIELAERKRSEIYLQKQIDKLKEKSGDGGNYISEELDGGDTDA